LLEKCFSLKTEKFICISNAMKNDMLKVGIPSNKAVLIENGVDLERFYPRSEIVKISKLLGIKAQGPVIGTISRMVSEKGQIYLIKALKYLASEWSDLRCIFIGEGPLYSGIKNAARNFGVEDICLFLDARNDVELIYPLLDLFVLPSLREPFGLVLLEAMACGVPVIATSAGGPPEFILSGVNGILVPPRNGKALAEEISHLLLNKEKASKIRNAGLKTVQNRFNVREKVNKIDQVYFSLS